jgi:type I restriction enzyme R subunit
MNKTLPKFQEEYSAKIPALTLLTQLGWRFLSPDAALSARDGKADEVVLRPLLREALAQRRFHFAGRDYPLSERAMDNIIAQVCSPALNEGLLIAN